MPGTKNTPSGDYSRAYSFPIIGELNQGILPISEMRLSCTSLVFTSDHRVKADMEVVTALHLLCS